MAATSNITKQVNLSIPTNITVQIFFYIFCVCFFILGR